MRRTGLAVVAVLLLAGCNSNRPEAPALGEEPEFKNSGEGLRFLAPPHWLLSARSNLPSEPSPKERTLVIYHNPPHAPQALFEVTRRPAGGHQPGRPGSGRIPRVTWPLAARPVAGRRDGWQCRGKALHRQE